MSAQEEYDVAYSFSHPLDQWQAASMLVAIAQIDSLVDELVRGGLDDDERHDRLVTMQGNLVHVICLLTEGNGVPHEHVAEDHTIGVRQAVLGRPQNGGAQ